MKIDKLRGKLSLWIPHFENKFYKHLTELLEKPPDGWTVRNSGMYIDAGAHPKHFTDYECEFAVTCLIGEKGRHIDKVLDVGSYRHFVIGLQASFVVTVLDVRQIQTDFKFDHVNVLHCDSKLIDAEDDSFDAVVSLCTIEHCGLGRYGDDYDLQGDIKSMREMTRVLRPDGLFIFSVPVSRTMPCIAYNSHRIYSIELIREMCERNHLDCVEEYFFSSAKNIGIHPNEVIADVGGHDVYCGCYRKIEVPKVQPKKVQKKKATK